MTQAEESDTRKFTPDTVKELLRQVLTGNYKPPNDAGHRRITDELNRIYEREVFGVVYETPHIFWRAGVILPRDKAVRKGKRWHRFVTPAAKTVQTELAQANSNLKTPIGLSDDGPVLRFTVKVIEEITGEEPAATAVAKELERQR
jgi:hypothetical protein